MSSSDLRCFGNPDGSVHFFYPRRFGALILVGKSSNFTENPEMIHINDILSRFCATRFFSIFARGLEEGYRFQNRGKNISELVNDREVISSTH